MKFKVVKLTQTVIPYHTWGVMDDETYHSGPYRFNYYIDTFGIKHLFTKNEAWSYYNKKNPIQYTAFHTRDQARAVLKRYQMGETSFFSKIKNEIHYWLSLPLWCIK